MNGRQKDYNMSRLFVDLDLTPVLIYMLDLLGKREEKLALERSLKQLSGHQVEFARILSQAFQEVAKQMPKLFQKRIEEHRASLRVGKVFSFRSSSSIEKEAVRQALEDSMAMMKEISMMNNESVRSLVEEHTEILRRINATMEELVKEERLDRINIDFDAIRKLLEGETK